MPVDFAETAQQEIDDILTVNIAGTLRITSTVLPGMLAKCVFSPPPGYGPVL